MGRYVFRLGLEGPDVPEELRHPAVFEVEASSRARAMLAFVERLPGELAEAWRLRLEQTRDPAAQARMRAEIAMARALEQKING